ncbi:hypothetical protein BESB_004280 [Besnoitia besnoiti]|uniref:Uncharacterized protein n=1 Tax=Besnoitia besnoiti TaxID=94643 RepID=A0A2A9MPS4_BESBE|nr:hypothetical protein BESB_004280 [Besnoitia besnoiti]PFH38087.1 hypothetical protein BESB_004280 [Besnoitia besnoiti]
MPQFCAAMRCRYTRRRMAPGSALFLVVVFSCLFFLLFVPPAFSAEIHPADRQCASFSRIKVPFFLLDKAYTYDLSALVTAAPPTGWVCQATHTAPHRETSPLLFAIFSSFLGEPPVGASKGRVTSPSEDVFGARGGKHSSADPHYELAGGARVFYAFNPCRLLSQDCVNISEASEGGVYANRYAVSRRGRLFKYKGPVEDGNCIGNLVPNPLPLTPWRAELKKMEEQTWMRVFDDAADSRAGVPAPDGVVTDGDDPRWSPLDALEAEAGLQAIFRVYEPSCPAQIIRVKVKIECAAEDAAADASPFHRCQESDPCVYEMTMKAKAGCPTGSTTYRPALPFLSESDSEASSDATEKAEKASTAAASSVEPKRAGAALPAVSVAAVKRVLEAAQATGNGFLLSEMRSLSSAGLLDASVKEKLSAAAPHVPAAPTLSATEATPQPTSLPAGESRPPSVASSSWMLHAPASVSFASLSSSVPGSLRAFLTHPVVPTPLVAGGDPSAETAHKYALLRIALCALIIFGAYWAIKDWITREFAVRGTGGSAASKGLPGSLASSASAASASFAGDAPHKIGTLFAAAQGAWTEQTGGGGGSGRPAAAAGASVQTARAGGYGSFCKGGGSPALFNFYGGVKTAQASATESARARAFEASPGGSEAFAWPQGSGVHTPGYGGAEGGATQSRAERLCVPEVFSLSPTHHAGKHDASIPLAASPGAGRAASWRDGEDEWFADPTPEAAELRASRGSTTASHGDDVESGLDAARGATGLGLGLDRCPGSFFPEEDAGGAGACDDLHAWTEPAFAEDTADALPPLELGAPRGGDRDARRHDPKASA